MNILFLTDELNYSDGVSTHLYYLLTGLKDKYTFNISLMCSGGNALDKFIKSDIEVIVSKHLSHSTRSKTGFAQGVYEILNIVRNKNINVLHSHNHYAANIASVVKKLFRRKHFNTFQTLHGIIPDTGKLNHVSAEYYIAVNDQIKYYLINKLNMPNRVKLIFNGVGFNNSINKVYNKKIRFVFASRLVSDKNADVFIKSVSGVNETNKLKAEFAVIGNGNEFNALKELDDKLKTGIEFDKNVTDMRKFFKNTDVYVICSANEGLPMTLLEAAAEKVMIISSDFPGIESILKNGTEGLIYNSAVTSGLTSAINHIIENPDLIKIYADEFFQNAKSKFNSVEMTDRHFEFYSE